VNCYGAGFHHLCSPSPQYFSVSWLHVAKRVLSDIVFTIFANIKSVFIEILVISLGFVGYARFPLIFPERATQNVKISAVSKTCEMSVDTPPVSPPLLRLWRKVKDPVVTIPLVNCRLTKHVVWQIVIAI
jgi:hypothetical protein